ncbi:MAG: indole-3-glycerol phosphate synthase [Myxococcota bacterium]|jgi:indole-3-glycerol phosphate synthase
MMVGQRGSSLALWPDMADFLATMAKSSRARADQLHPAEVRSHAAMRTPPRLNVDGFIIIAECKLSAPSVGVLTAPDDPTGEARRRAKVYADAGATAVSVLSEPSRFAGDIDHVLAASACSAPVMRKDFLVDPAQVWEARAAGAGGVLLIATMLKDDILLEMLHTAAEADLFVLVEGFDADDLERIGAVAHGWTGSQPFLAGLNCRDLRSLQVNPNRFAELAPHLPTHVPVLAESGIEDGDGAKRVRDLGYGGVLIGSALMRADDPAAVIRSLR